MAIGEIRPGMAWMNRLPEGSESGVSAGAAIAKRSLSVAAHRTSISLEDAFWTGLRDIAALRGIAAAALVAEIDRDRGGANLSSAIRVFVLTFYRERAGVAVAGSGRGAMAQRWRASGKPA